MFVVWCFVVGESIRVSHTGRYFVLGLLPNPSLSPGPLLALGSGPGREKPVLYLLGPHWLPASGSAVLNVAKGFV